MLNIGRWLGYNYENKTTMSITQDEIRSQLRNPIEKKPAGYKNVNTSAVRFLQNGNLSAN